MDRHSESNTTMKKTLAFTALALASAVAFAHANHTKGVTRFAVK